ncbi:elongator complex protein 2 [Anopheles bellator]|uniref:elongator complex protein 2 n=1 Tax=Anopheles bellator TaxID=139047 RepID=UPI0026472748|nr:elongator complex protein 2 [Anopheles bellator]
MLLKTLYTAAACNRTPHALDWADDGLIYFATKNAIAVLDPAYHGSLKIVRILAGHKGQINVVRAVRHGSSCHGGIHLLSGSNDGTCILWNTANDSVSAARFILSGHCKGVTTVEAFVESSNRLLVASGSVDSTIKLWHADNGGTRFECFQTIDLRTGLTFGLRLFPLATSNVTMLAYTTDTDMINLCVEQQAAGDAERSFVQVEQLKGHFDWVRGIDYVRLPGSNDCLLASSSQDTFIRLWRISPRESLRKQKAYADIGQHEDITLEERTFSVRAPGGKNYHYALSLESVLQGHEGWVYGVHFCVRGDEVHLLSSSIDKSLIGWTPSESGVWVESVRVGEVGGSSLGFYGGKFSPDGRSIIGHGFQGSFHLWHEDEQSAGLWKPGTIVGGHFGGVRDLAWDPAGGEYLISLSDDQTTRIHAPWRRPVEDVEQITWHEIARPQVHGYDMQCLALLSRYRLASAAEEKIIRIFQAPRNFVENFRALCGLTDDSEGNSVVDGNPMGASVPSLGLSNKAVFDVEQPATEGRHIKDMYPEHYFNPISMDRPPAEETLMQNTLWPEIQKLYGHGNELYSVAVSPDSRLIASACRAASADHAQILLWDTTTWRIVQQLSAHQLTVTQICFSPNNRLLLAVSRDRTFSVFERSTADDGSPDFQLRMRSDKKSGVHTRIIWCCDWSHDSETFATGSRDGKVVAWKRNQSGAPEYVPLAVLDLKNESITALAFARSKIGNDRYLVAIGLERGTIKLYALGEWTMLLDIGVSNAHHLTVKRLSFRPHVESHQLASCGEDGLVRIYSIEV